jgi:protein-disulfide isomerase/uncharacterized membrane protein
MGSDRRASAASGAPRARRARAATDARTRRLWMASLVLLLVGLALSVELVRLHFEAASDPAHHSYCSVNDTVSCDAVSRSKYAVLFGVPVAVWGVFGYVAMALTAWLGLRWRSRAPAALLATLSGFAASATVLLAAISHFVIHAWCLVCIGTYVVNVAVGILSLSLLDQQGARASYRALLEQFEKERRRTVAVVGLAGATVVGLVVLWPPTRAPALLVAPRPVASPGAPEPSVPAIPPAPPGARVEVGETSEGLPWIGAPKPVVTITEFFDYECAHCRQAFHGLHELLEVNPDRLRVVLRHFPLDKSCNHSIRNKVYEHSCGYAKLANCAKEQQRFWDAHEYLFEHSSDKVETADFATALKLNPKALRACLKREDKALNRDIEAGVQLDLHGTPAFVVDGKTYIQGLPPSLAERLRTPAGWR